MPINNEYKRYFIILQEDGKNYGIASGKSPTGYVKIEMRNGSGRVNTFIQNLRIDRNAEYKVLIVAPEKNIGVNLGRILVDGSGRGELNIDVNSANVMNSNCDISKFSVAAICDGGSFPLSGYIGRDRVTWKGKYIVVNDSDKKVENISREVEKVKKHEIVEDIEEKCDCKVLDEENCAEECIEELEEKLENEKLELETAEKPELGVEEIQMKKEPCEVDVCEEIINEELCEEEKYEEYPKCEECKIIEEEMPIPQEIECKIEEAEMIVPQKMEYEECECEKNEEYMECEENREYIGCENEILEEELEIDREPEESIDYKCCDMNCECNTAYYDTNMYFSLKKTMRKMARCTDFDDEECEWFMIGDRLKYLNSVMVRVTGNYMLLSYPVMVNEIASRCIDDCKIGLKYDDEGAYVKSIVYAVPGERNIMHRRYFRRLGYTEYRDGYYLLYIDISK